jgi:hypothetical protein
LDHLAFQALMPQWVLKQCVEDRRQFRMPQSSSANVADSHVAYVGSHRAAGDRQFSKVETLTRAAGFRSHHYETHFCRTDETIAWPVRHLSPERFKARGFATSKDGHPTPARIVFGMRRRIDSIRSWKSDHAGNIQTEDQRVLNLQTPAHDLPALADNRGADCVLLWSLCLDSHLVV